MTLDFHTALLKLVPGATWEWPGFDYANLVWKDTIHEKPPFHLIVAMASQIEADRVANDYKARRAAEYPPVTDYLDAVVKGDKEQLQQYVEACLAVKAKYPKPTV